MFDVDDIRDWRGESVVDRDGSKIGNLEAVYFDTSTDEAVFATVKVGLVGGGRLVFVPLIGAKVSPKHIRVLTDKRTAKDRSEEHTSELQSRQYLVCRLLLEKKKKTTISILSTQIS